MVLLEIGRFYSIDEFRLVIRVLGSVVYGLFSRLGFKLGTLLYRGLEIFDVLAVVIDLPSKLGIGLCSEIVPI
jgi:hypothetical protein